MVAGRVFSQLCEDVLSGRYEPGEKLPTQRALAAELDVNMASVREAVKRLEQLGLVEGGHVLHHPLPLVRRRPHGLRLRDKRRDVSERDAKRDVRQGRRRHDLRDDRPRRLARPGARRPPRRLELIRRPPAAARAG